MLSALRKHFFPGPNDLDLRYFRWMQLSQTIDGKGIAHEGLTTDILFYNGHRVYSRTTLRDFGSTEGRNESGNDFYLMMSRVAENYLRILQTVSHKTGVSKDPAGDFFDTIAANKEEFDILSNHPQFQEMKDQFTELGFEIEVVDNNNTSVYTITVTKIEETLPT